MNATSPYIKMPAIGLWSFHFLVPMLSPVLKTYKLEARSWFGSIASAPVVLQPGAVTTLYLSGTFRTYQAGLALEFVATRVTGNTWPYTEISPGGALSWADVQYIGP